MRIWALYGVLLLGLVYALVAGMQSAYASDACTAAECNAVHNLCHSFCATYHTTGNDNCTVGATTWLCVCDDGLHETNGICP
jgi:hypothetical protein